MRYRFRLVNNAVLQLKLLTRNSQMLELIVEKKVQAGIGAISRKSRQQTTVNTCEKLTKLKII